ncbi:nuclease domain-containing protein [Ramlibacter sp.]|uniref:nuclease domain-containing protein n=1 Tax=Ramlibacter sp. TaxID=1917967 RepID=UPI003D0A6186
MTRASREYQERRDRERADRHERIGRQTPPANRLHHGVMGGPVGVAMPVPKSKPYRDAALLAMAKDRPCLMLVPGMCSHRTDTTVAAHSNFSAHGGKAKGRRADDCFSVWACEACHIRWLDQPIGHNGPTKAQKESAFMAAHSRQVMAWRVISTDPSEPERFRRAARRALEHLNASMPPKEWPNL